MRILKYGLLTAVAVALTTGVSAQTTTYTGSAPVLNPAQVWPNLTTTWPDGVNAANSTVPCYPVQGTQTTALPAYDCTTSSVALKNSSLAQGYYTPLIIPTGACYYVTNTSSNNYFVPLRTENEWLAFANSVNGPHPPPGLTLIPCNGQPGAPPAPVLAAATPPGSTSTIFGTIGAGGSGATGFLYKLTPIPDPAAYLGVAGSMTLMTTADRVAPYSTMQLNIPRQSYTLGFPGFPSLQSWFGLCYDGTWTIPAGGAGAYTIVATVDDAVAVWIDGRLVGEDDDGNINSSILAMNTGLPYNTIASMPPLILAAGPHSIQVMYYQGWPVSLGLQLWAVPPTETTYVSGTVPASTDIMQLTAPIGTPPIACP
ncbi:MAG: hypothetical protein WCD70_16015 [Alphaproteobacteria bacterium]